MPKPKQQRDLPQLSRRIRRWQDVCGYTNQAAAFEMVIPLRTYTNILYGEHLPRGYGRVMIEQFLTQQEKAMQLPPIE